MKETGHSAGSEVLTSAKRADLQIPGDTHLRDSVKSEGWTRESFLQEVISELRLTRKKSGSRCGRERVLGSRRL